MALSFLSRFRIKPEKEQTFVDIVPQIEEISLREPDTLAYKFYRLDEPGMFAVFESFTNEEADVAHQQNPEAVELIKVIITCIDGTYVREYLRDI